MPGEKLPSRVDQLVRLELLGEGQALELAEVFPASGLELRVELNILTSQSKPFATFVPANSWEKKRSSQSTSCMGDFSNV